MTDKIGSMIIMLKNASSASRPSITVPYSKLRQSIAESLVVRNFVKSLNKKTKKGQNVLEILLAYEDKKPRISGVKRISKPSRRVYFGVKDLRKAFGEQGTIFLSTPKGILSDKDAKKEMVGGEA